MSPSYKVYGISDCPACLRARADLMTHYPHVEFTFINTDFSPSRRQQLKDHYGFPTFPIVARIKNGEEILIGGHAELVAHLGALNFSPSAAYYDELVPSPSKDE